MKMVLEVLVASSRVKVLEMERRDGLVFVGNGAISGCRQKGNNGLRGNGWIIVPSCLRNCESYRQGLSSRETCVQVRVERIR